MCKRETLILFTLLLYLQGQKAQELVTSAQAEGCWVFLQNCHIVPEWLPDLKKLCESFSLQNTSMLSLIHIYCVLIER